MPSAPGASPAAVARAAVDRRTGVVRKLLAAPRADDDPAVVHVEARLGDFAHLPAGGSIAETGGSGARPEAAWTSALFETLERYAAAFVDRRRLVLARPTADGPFLHGERYPLYADFQYARPDWPFRPLTERSEIWWAEGRSLATGATCFVPAAFVFVPYHATSEDEWLGPGTSTGMASGPGWAAACASGLLEVCERDAFMITWLNRLSRPRLRVPPGSPLGRRVADVLARRRGRVTFVDLTTDLRVPTVLAALETRLHGRPVRTFGAAARPTYEAAADKALLEACSDLMRLQIVLDGPDRDWRPVPDFSNVNDFGTHSQTYLDPALQPVLDFLTASPEERDLGPPGELTGAGADAVLLELVARFAAVGLDPVAVTLTTRDLAELGVEVVKMIVPGAAPLPPDHRWQWLGHRRVYEVPRRIGARDRDATPDDLLLDHPHPFA
jgi:ribosomal protein S12 methylthiotransferase accessory factor